LVGSFAPEGHRCSGCKQNTTSLCHGGDARVVEPRRTMPFCIKFSTRITE
jgi:hypothetical protein